MDGRLNATLCAILAAALAGCQKAPPPAPANAAPSNASPATNAPATNAAAAGTPADAVDAAAAKAFLDYLKTPEAVSVFKAKGVTAG